MTSGLTGTGAATAGVAAPERAAIGAADKAAFGFRLVLSRPPGEKEKKLLVELFDKSRKLFASSPVEAKKMATSYAGAAPEGADLADLAAWAVVGNVLLNLDETIARP